VLALVLDCGTLRSAARESNSSGIADQEFECPSSSPMYLQKLVTIGYLRSTSGKMDGIAVRAVQRFQRHSARPYRMPQPDESAAGLSTGRVTGTIDAATAAQVDKWINRGWRLPLNRFPTKELSEGGRLRADAATAWETIIGLVSGAGGTLKGPYGDTTRPVRPNSKVGASRFSFHYFRDAP
jgi:hypothetical protein